MSASQVFASTLAFPMNKAISILSALALGTRSVHFAAYPGSGGFGGDGKIVVENTVTHPIQLKLTYNK